METRFAKARMVPGTKSFHQFIPLPQGKICVKQTSVDTNFEAEFSLTGEPIKDEKIKEKLCVGCFLVCSYDDFLWLGLLSELDTESKDAKVNFLHPHLPGCSFAWPRREDICWVPIENRVMMVEAPRTSTLSGRQYYLCDRNVAKVANYI